MSFFVLTDNSIRNTDSPWIERVVSGLELGRECSTCGRTQRVFTGDIEAALSLERGVFWPDVLGGALPYFIVSERVIDVWQKEGVSSPPRYNVSIVGDLPTSIQPLPQPRYFWIDGEKMRGALLNIEAADYVGWRFCQECGSFLYDITKTLERQRTKPWGWYFKEGSWNGSRIFTTDFSAGKFFCTNEVFRCAQKHRFTNFKFIPAAQGKGRGIDYLNLPVS